MHPFPLRRLVLGLPVLALAAAPAHAAGSIRIQVSPNVLVADGNSTATVTAEVRNTSGRPVRDGTEVRFYTTAGSITQVGFTSGGVARATLTSSAVPQAANISVSAGVDQAVVTVPMVSKLVEAAVGGRVMRITGKYVAFSEDKKFIQADEQVRVRFRGVDVEANSVQIDLNGDTLKAIGKIQVASDRQTRVGERLWLDLKSFEGYIVTVGSRVWFSAYGLTELPERPKNLNPDFDLVDLTDSKLLWVSRQANYVVGERVQVQGARAYVGGIRSLRMPFHEASLGGSGFGTEGQYVGVGSEGITLDLPLYVRMTPGASTAFNVNYGSRSGGVGYFTRQRGLSVDLVQKYGFTGASEGEARLTNLSSFSRWGAMWNHNQQLGKNTRLVTNLQFPEHRNFYGGANLISGLPVGTLTASFSGSRPRRGSLATDMGLTFETKPRPILDGKVGLSFDTAYRRRDSQQFRVARGVRVPVGATEYQSLGARLRPQSVRLPLGLTLDSSVSLRGVRSRGMMDFGPSLETHLRRALPNNGTLTLGVSYNRLARFTDILPTQGSTFANVSLNYPITSRLRISAFGSMALDADSRNALMQLNYQITPKWRFEILSSLFRFGQFGSFDYQLGIARSLGNRELMLYWSQREHRVLIEFGAARF